MGGPPRSERKREGKYDDAEPLYVRAIAIGEKSLGPEHPDLAVWLNYWAGLLKAQGKYDQAVPLYDRSIAIREKVHGPDHPAVASALHNRALLLKAQGNYDEAGKLCERSLGIREKALGPDHRDVAQSLAGSLEAQVRAARKFQGSLVWYRIDFGSAQHQGERARALTTFFLSCLSFMFQGKYDQARLLRYNRSLAKRAEMFEKDAEGLKAQGNYDEAGKLYERSLAIREKALGPDHPDVAQSLNKWALLLESQVRAIRIPGSFLWYPIDSGVLNNRALLLKAQGNYDEAGKLYERSLAIREKALGPDHPDVAQSLNNWALLLESQVRAIRIPGSFLWYPIHSGVLNNRALLLKAQGKYDEAGKLCERSLAIREKALGPDHPDVAQSLNNWALLLESQVRAIRIPGSFLWYPIHSGVLNNRALLLKAQGNYDEAGKLYERSLAIREKALGPDHPDVAQSLNNWALLLEAQVRAIRIPGSFLWYPIDSEALNNRVLFLKAQGNYDEAGKLYERSLAISEKALGPDHPDVAQSLNNWALLLESQGVVVEGTGGSHQKISGNFLWYPIDSGMLNDAAEFLSICSFAFLISTWHLKNDSMTLPTFVQGEYAEGEPQYARATYIWEKALGPAHPQVATALNNRALLLESQVRAIRIPGSFLWYPIDSGVLNNRALLLKAQGNYDEAGELYERSLAIRKTAALGPYHPDVAQWLNNWALLLESQGKYDQAGPLYDRSLAIRENVQGPDHPAVALTLNNRAGLLKAQGNYDEAGKLYERSLAIREKALGPDHPDVAQSLNNWALLLESQVRAIRIPGSFLWYPIDSGVLNNRALLLKAQGKYDEAGKLYERSLAIREKALGPDHPDVAQSLNNWAVLLESQVRAIRIPGSFLWYPIDSGVLNNRALLLKAQGNYDEAGKLYERSLAIREKALGPDHPDVAQSLNNWALLLESQGKYDQAGPLYDRSLAIREKVQGPDHPAVALTLNNRAGLLKAQGNYDEAGKLYERSLAIREKALGPDHPDVAQSLNNWALLLESQVRAIRIPGSFLWYPIDSGVLNNRALLLKAQGNYDEAGKLYERSLAIREKALGPDHPDVAQSLNNWALLLESQVRAIRIPGSFLWYPIDSGVLNNRALLLKAQGNYDEAGKLYERSLAIREKALGPDHPDVARSLINKALLLESQRQSPGIDGSDASGEGRGGGARRQSGGTPRRRWPGDPGPLHTETLARSLGPNPCTFGSASLGVELEVEADSLSAEVHHPVTVSPRLLFVECDSRAPSHEGCGKEEFLAMTFVHGPKEAIFLDNKPAKLRFFMGFVDEFAAGASSDRVVNDEDIEKHILETYRPLTSPDGVGNWTALEPYTVHFRSPVLGGREVWVEIALKHFCTVANGTKTAVVPNIPGYNHKKSGNLPYLKGDIGGLFGPLRRKVSREKSARPMVRLGNATQASRTEYATFTIYPRIEHRAVAQNSDYHFEAGGEIASVGVGQGQGSSVEGAALDVAKRPITKIVAAGDYDDCEVLCDLGVHLQMNVKIGVIENLEAKDNVRHSKGTLQVLDVEAMGGNRILVLRPKRLRMPCSFPVLPWPSTPWVIMNHGE
ncbi:unnamed protein product [Ectocarpus sp. CCAP 1310/34]|nr:unnamed protein product [Ectocarpus sp. CCAP 1310/34]